MVIQTKYGSQLMISFFRLCLGLVNSPADTFLKLKNAGIRSALIALFVQILFSGALIAVYYQWVNFDWLLVQLAKDLSPEEGEALVEVLTPAILSVSGLLGSVLILPLIFLIFALYLFLVGKIYNLDENYSQWFVLVTWSAMPNILTLPLGLFAMLLSDGRLLTDQLNPLALNMLIGLEAESPWRTLASSVTVLLFGNLALTIIGLRVWTHFTWVRSTIIALIPYAVIYIPWAGIVIGSSEW